MIATAMAPAVRGEMELQDRRHRWSDAWVSPRVTTIPNRPSTSRAVATKDNKSRRRPGRGGSPFTAAATVTMTQRCLGLPQSTPCLKDTTRSRVGLMTHDHRRLTRRTAVNTAASDGLSIPMSPPATTRHQ